MHVQVSPPVCQSATETHEGEVTVVLVKLSLFATCNFTMRDRGTVTQLIYANVFFAYGNMSKRSFK